MTNSIQVSVLCASGRIASFGDNDVTERTTTTLQTSGTGLNQTSGVDLGNFLVGETIVAAFATVTAATTVADTVGFMYAFVENADGSIAVPIEGGGNKASNMPMLCRPVRVQVGMLLKAALAITDATATDASLVAYCASGKTSVFTVGSLTADTKTAIVDITTGGTIGQSLAGQRVVKYYATFTNLYGINDDQGGNNFYYAESSQGQLKGTFFPKGVRGFAKVEMLSCNIPILQNDTLSVMWGS